MLTAIALTVLGPAIWVQLLGNATPLFPYDAPGLFSMIVAFAGCWLASTLDSSPQAQADRASFAAQHVRSQTGIGASAAAEH